MSSGSGVEPLFTYGTLQLPQVQLDTFGRVVEGDEDVLPGYRREWTPIDDDRVTNLSGMDAHPIVRFTGDPRDPADEYEVSLYRRVSVSLSSGRQAWVYVGR